MKLLRYVTLLALIGTAVPSHAALVFLWPKDNGIVREGVNVAIDAKSVPADSYVSFYLNDTFMVAVGEPSTISGGRKAYTWAWDTREPINLGAINDEAKRPADGQYEIRGQAVDATGKVVDQATVKVRLANRVTSVSQDTPVDLKYRFSAGAQRKYSVRVSVTVSEIGGAPISSTQQVQSLTYVGAESIADVRSATLALVRYYPSDTSLRQFGRPLGELPGFDAGSKYELVDNYGRVVEEDMFSTAGIMVDPAFAVDYRLPLPRGKVRAGDQWTGPLGFSMPAMGKAASVDGEFRLEGLEWAGGRECARIGSDITGTSEFTFTPVAQGGAMGGPDMGFGPSGPMAVRPGKVTGKCTDWFAFRSGQLIRREATLDVDAYMDSNAVQAINEGLGLSGAGESGMPAPESPAGYSSPSSSGSAPGDEEMALVEDYQRRVGSIFGSGAGPGASTVTQQGTRVKFKVRVSARLLN